MSVREIKENVGGIKGSFLIKGKSIIESDLDINVSYISKSISYLNDVLHERERDVKKITVTGSDSTVFYLDTPYILGVVASSQVNLPLLDLVAAKILKNVTSKRAVEKSKLSSIEDEVPSFKISPDIVIPYLSDYEMNVLKYVNGKNTVREIVELSEEPQEVVARVIVAYIKKGTLTLKPTLRMDFGDRSQYHFSRGMR
ncbi:MAG: hypothetical protein ACE5K0_08290 [Candidatus Methanofastidiosia archaeon]